MSEVVERMIARIHAPLSALQPILPSVFTPPSLVQEQATDSELPVPVSPLEVRSRQQIEPNSLLKGPGEKEQHDDAALRLYAGRVPATLPAEALVKSEFASPHQVRADPRKTNPQAAQPEGNEPPVLQPAIGAPEPANQPAFLEVVQPVTRVTASQQPETRFAEILPLGDGQDGRERRAAGAASTMGRERANPSERVPTTTEVFISIGHIEVRAAPPIQPARTPKPRPTVTLQSYLNRRRGEAS